VVAKKQEKFVSPLAVGTKVFIRTVTMHYTGRVVGLTRTEILIADAAWIAESVRFATTLKTGELSEVEPYPEGVVVSVNRESLCDVSRWLHDLPREQK
jgi:hypothetical protein